VLSPLTFLIVIDWRSADINRSTLGLSWISDGNLCDLDFADDIALLNSSWDGMKELTNMVEKEAATVGLLISTEKTTLMAVGECDMTSNKHCNPSKEYRHSGGFLLPGKRDLQ